MPFWAVVVEDAHHNAAPGALILGSRERAKVLAAGLRVVADHVPKGNWNPNWMIDKDSKEFKAIKEDLRDIFTNKVHTHNYKLLLTPLLRCFYVIFTVYVPGRSN
jgi:hypothetical protein